MAEAIATAPTTGTESTPPVSTETVVAPVAEATTTESATSAVTAESPQTVTTAEATQDGKPVEAVAEAPAPLFQLPEDLKVHPDSVSKFEAVLRQKLQPDGSLKLTGQEVVDLYAAQARDAAARWQTQIKQIDADNAAECKQRFTPSQLAAAETAVGFLSSYDTSIREWAKQQLNDPRFTNAMRLIGERLQEDTFERAGTAPQPDRRTAAQRMGYAKRA